ncbi:hypothetical protein F5883DRAFT_512232 [Diaporthe sp. PMI_573]|nr:hypothetical protein F5883DRAFT_512232 [Diaporthaceae sp. PMI_573]
MALSISLRLNGMQANLCQQPHLCDEALVLGSEFLDQVATVRDLRLALKEPRPQKSMRSFLRFVFESSPPLDQLALDRKLKLRKMDSISLVLCSATYTEKMVLSFSEGRFRALYSNCCEFLGGPGNIAANLPVDVVDTAVRARMVPQDYKAYAVFLKGLEEYQRARKAIPPLLPARILTPAERLSNFGTSITWPQEHVAAILCVKGQSQRLLKASSLVLLGQLARLYKESGRDIPFPDDVTEAFSAASKSAPLNDRIQILDIAAEMLTDSAPPPARATIVHQRSVTLRLLGNSHQAEHEILSFLEKAPDIPELLLKSLKLSLAESRVYQFRHHEAHDIARSIEVGGDISEFQLLWDHIYCIGRIMRGRGEFESAKVCFERCCASTQGIRPFKVVLTQCALADIYCELDHLSGDPQHFHLLQAKSVLEPAVKSVGQTDSKSRRRLLLSLSEVYIRQLRVHEATAILKELITLFDGLKYPDIIDRLGHVRIYMTLARSCPSSQSMTYWKEALRLNKAYNPDEEEVFTCAVIYLNLSWLSYSEGQLELGQEMHARAGEVLQRRRPQYLMPGIGTYVYEDTLCKLQTKTL